MAVPKFFEFFTPLLEVLQEHGDTKVKDLCPHIVAKMNLSKEDLEQMIPSKKKYTYKDRIDWSIQYLKNAGLIARVSHGTYCITDEGKNALVSGEVIDLEYLEKFDSFKAFHGGTGSGGAKPAHIPPVVDVTPQEAMETAYNKINDELAKGLLKTIMDSSPDFFEKLVVDLLLAMGYGYNDKSGMVTGKTGDGGIDGIINEDKLGFDQVYVQAKRWNADHKVSSPDVQAFVGALVGRGATKGLFITTGQFTASAINVAKDTKTIKLVLIDGHELTKLMIAFGVGVSKQTTYTIMQIDNDYFDE